MSDRRGFTLVELLVSLAILSVALAVLFGAISSSLDRTRKERDEASATSLVQSLLARGSAGEQAGEAPTRTAIVGGSPSHLTAQATTPRRATS